MININYHIGHHSPLNYLQIVDSLLLDPSISKDTFSTFFDRLSSALIISKSGNKSTNVFIGGNGGGYVTSATDAINKILKDTVDIENEGIMPMHREVRKKLELFLEEHVDELIDIVLPVIDSNKSKEESATTETDHFPLTETILAPYFQQSTHYFNNVTSSTAIGYLTSELLCQEWPEWTFRLINALHSNARFERIVLYDSDDPKVIPFWSRLMIVMLHRVPIEMAGSIVSNEAAFMRSNLKRLVHKPVQEVILKLASITDNPALKELIEKFTLSMLKEVDALPLHHMTCSLLALETTNNSGINSNSSSAIIKSEWLDDLLINLISNKSIKLFDSDLCQDPIKHEDICVHCDTASECLRHVLDHRIDGLFKELTLSLINSIPSICNALFNVLNKKSDPSKLGMLRLKFYRLLALLPHFNEDMKLTQIIIEHGLCKRFTTAFIEYCRGVFCTPSNNVNIPLIKDMLQGARLAHRILDSYHKWNAKSTLPRPCPPSNLAHMPTLVDIINDLFALNSSEDLLKSLLPDGWRELCSSMLIEHKMKMSYQLGAGAANKYMGMDPETALALWYTKENCGMKSNGANFNQSLFTNSPQQQPLFYVNGIFPTGPDERLTRYFVHTLAASLNPDLASLIDKAQITFDEDEDDYPIQLKEKEKPWVNIEGQLVMLSDPEDAMDDHRKHSLDSDEIDRQSIDSESSTRSKAASMDIPLSLSGLVLFDDEQLDENIVEDEISDETESINSSVDGDAEEVNIPSPPPIKSTFSKRF